MKIFNEWIEGFSMTQDTREDLKAFRSWLTERYTSASSINLTLSVVRKFYKSLHEKGIINTDPTVVLKNVADTHETKKATISREQFYMISLALKEDLSVNAPRNRAIFLLAVMNGLRVSEMSNINIQDFGIDSGKRVIYLLRKGYIEKSNFIVLQDKTYKMLMALIGDRTEGALFVSHRSKEAMTGGDISRILKTLLKKNGIDSPKITAHSMRHSYAHFALDGGADLMALSASMNHKNLSTTQRYLRSYDRLKNSAEDAVNLDF